MNRFAAFGPEELQILRTCLIAGAQIQPSESARRMTEHLARELNDARRERLGHVQPLPRHILDDLRALRKRAPNTWACCSEYRNLTKPFCNWIEPTDARAITEITEQMERTTPDAPNQRG